MKYKIHSSLLIYVGIFWLLVQPVYAFLSSDAKKAKEFMQAGMYPQAIELLDKRINEKPTDAEAHFQLGICHINTGNYGGADKRFGSAVRLEPDYGYKIGEQYEMVGSEALNGRDAHKALRLYGMAIKYQPNLAEKIAQKCFEKMDNYFYPAKPKSTIAQNLAAFIRACSPIYNEKIRVAERAYAVKCLKIAKGKPERKRKPYTEEAENYLTQKEIRAIIPPEYIIYQPGFYKFKLKAGEKTDHWIVFPSGRLTHFDISSSDNMFKIQYRDGEIVEAWNSGKPSNKKGRNADFKIIAVTDQAEIKLLVK